MICRILFKDFLRFASIFVVFLFGFSEAFYVISREQGWDAFLLRVYDSFGTMIGGDESSLDSDRLPLVAQTLYIAYTVVAAVLLLNLLIAMMADTYTKISEDSDHQWHMEWARIIYSIEFEMGAADRELKDNKYWTVINGKRFLVVEDIDCVSEEEELKCEKQEKKNAGQGVTEERSPCKSGTFFHGN